MDRKRRLKSPRITKRHLRLFDEGLPFLPWAVDRFGKWRAAKAGIEIDDLFQAARMGLWRAVLRYDPKTGVKLATYASQFITGAMLDAIDAARFGKRPRKNPMLDHSMFERLPFSDDDEHGSGVL